MRVSVRDGQRRAQPQPERACGRPVSPDVQRRGLIMRDRATAETSERTACADGRRGTSVTGGKFPTRKSNPREIKYGGK